MPNSVQPSSPFPNVFTGSWRRIVRLAGFDAQVVSTLLFRGWSVIAGGATVLLMPLWLGKIEQGFYYTFSSLLALQIFFELGLNQVILQLVSHDFAHLRVESDGVIAGDSKRLARLVSLIRLLHRWYLVASCAFVVLVGVAGTFFFATKGALPIAAWLGVWLLLSLVTAANLYLSVGLTVLEGCGEVARVARLRLVQSMGGYASMWLVLVAGGGLWAVPLVPLTGAVCTAIWLRRRADVLKRLKSQADVEPADRIQWRVHIFPMQWRIALSWVSGYFIFNLFTPLTFARQGAVEAGRLGVALAIFNALLTVAMSWVNAKVPTMAAYVSLHNRRQLNATFVAVAKRSLTFALIAAVAVLGASAMLDWIHAPIASRIASFPVLCCLGIVTVVNGFIFAAAAYMRAHKEEPMLFVSLASGLATFAAAWIGVTYGVFEMMAAYTGVVVFVSLPWTVWIFRKYYCQPG